MRIPVAFTVVAFGVAACHGTTSYVSGEGLATVTSAELDRGPCNSVEQRGKDVDLVGSSTAPPAPAGGTIEDGTYVLTSSVLHTKDKTSGAKLVGMGKITMLVQGPTSQLVRTGADGQVRRTTVSRVNAGDVTTSRTTCASPSSNDGKEPVSTRYTATSGMFQFITPGPAGTVVATYTKL
jgi:hypothetical protein